MSSRRRRRIGRFAFLVATLAWGLVVHAASAADGPRIDLNQDTARGDVRSVDWENWRVTEGQVAAFQLGSLEMKLEALDADRPLQTQWWKPGFDHPARMASDGVVCRGRVRLTVRGLPAGEHSLATYHNELEGAAPAPPLRVVCGSSIEQATPTARVVDDERAAVSYVRARIAAGEVLAVEYQSRDGGRVVLNGLELDRSDPRRRARTPSPADGDEHAVESPVLRWKAPADVRSYSLYLGASRDAVARADESAPEYQGDSSAAERPTVDMAVNMTIDHRQTWYWRVDSRPQGGGETVRGEVWRFRPRRLAFPGAEGYGRFAIGGRGGRVLEVTTLADAGPGSLREAVEADGPRTVVFRVGGLISLRSKLIVRNPYLTIAGQTAPGDGICVKNYTFGCADTHDVIVQHVRIRVGDESGTTQDGCGARGCDHVLFDHCSISWSIDEGFSSREARNITVQRCLIAEALHLAEHKKYRGTGKGHSFAGSISGNIGSFHHNLLAHCTGRNWSLAGGLDRTDQRLAGRLDIRSNVVFNWRDRTTDGGVRELCFVDNLYLPGPATTVFSLLKPDPGDAGRGMRAFVAGNVMEGKPQVAADNWNAFIGTAADREQIRATEPLWESHVTSQRPEQLLESLLDDVGATRPRRDAVDARIIADVRARRATFTGSRGQLPGIIDSQKDAGGWPDYQTGVAPADRDHDGLPDAWESTHRLDPDDPADAATYGSEGYTPLERYLHELTTAAR
ncbi:MAG: hypothetical protein U0939_25760 [Pirellulales bacterium]